MSHSNYADYDVDLTEIIVYTEFIRTMGPLVLVHNSVAYGEDRTPQRISRNYKQVRCARQLRQAAQ
jgi:hypothetical protein